jgi:glutaminyl-tRNA synthetase
MEEDEAAAMPGGFKRLTPRQAVRLRGAHVIRCSKVVRDPASGEVLRLHCEHDESTLGKKPVGYKAAGVIHWVSAEHGVPVTLRRFGNLFHTADAYEMVHKEEEEEQEVEFGCDQTQGKTLAKSVQTADTNLLLQNVDPSSLVESAGVVEPSVLEAVRAGSSSESELARRCWFQFEREGYYVLDERLDADGRLCIDGAQDGSLVFNMVVGLRQNMSSRATGSKGAKGRKDKNRKGKR